MTAVASSRRNESGFDRGAGAAGDSGVPLSLYADDETTRSSLERALRILGAFSAAEPLLSLAELTRRTQLPKTTVHRLLSELTKFGIVYRVGTSYRIGLRLFEIASLHHGSELREIARPFLEDLYEVTRETIHLAVLNGLDVVYLEKISGHQVCDSPSRFGGRMPAYCTAVGKVLLAFKSPALVERTIERGLEQRTPFTITDPAAFRDELKSVATNRFAYDREESRRGLVCVAAPVLDASREVAAAVSVSGPKSRMDPDKLIPTVQAIAMTISRALRRHQLAFEWDGEQTVLGGDRERRVADALQ